jgi:hypothetical protein
VGAVLPLDILPVNQPHKGLVKKRRGLQDVAAAFARHVVFAGVQFHMD